MIGRGATAAGPFTVACEIGAAQDPGYGATAKLLGESAMCLLRDDAADSLAGGILTPASGIGDPLADRLRGAGLTVKIDE